MPAYDGVTEDARERTRRLDAARKVLQGVSLAKFVACELGTLMALFRSDAGWDTIYSAEALISRLVSREH